MPSTTITVTGNVTREPELKFANSGTAVTKLSLAANRRVKKGDQWEDETSFFNVVCFGSLAENVANSITKGVRIVVTGELEQRSWEKEDGTKGSAVEIKAEDIGASLRWANASISKVASKSTQPEDAF